MFLDDAVMVAMWPYSKYTNVLHKRIMVVADGPYDWLQMVCRRMMRCLALVAINLMCAVNDSDESKVTPRNFALLWIDMFVLLIVTCLMFFAEVWRLPGKNICAVLPAFSPIL